MAVYVLLSFDDDNEAKAFVKSCLQRGKVLVADEKTNVHGVYPEVLGVYKRPTQFCNCATEGRIKGKLGFSFTQGRKYGWWVHVTCGKPTVAAGAVPGLFGTLGINLLPVQLTEERRYRGWDQTNAMWTLEELGVERAEADSEMSSVSESTEDGSNVTGVEG